MSGPNFLPYRSIGLVAPFFMAAAMNPVLAADFSQQPVAGPAMPFGEMDRSQLRSLDSIYGNKYWDIHYPSYADSLSRDIGGYRSILNSYGFAFIWVNTTISQANMLDTPRSVPMFSSNGLPYPRCNRTSGSICAGGQAYAGQSPLVVHSSNPTLVYDTSRWGVPDGNIFIVANITKSTNNNFLPDNWFSIQTLLWHQSAFNKKFELNIGYGQPLLEFAGTNIGGNFASTFGPSASVLGEMGLQASSGTPQVEVKWNITNSWYDQAIIAKSTPTNGSMHGLTGNPYQDEAISNPTGFQLLPSVSGTGGIFVNELGYRERASPDAMETWFRAGYIYNTGVFRDLSKLPQNFGSMAGTRGAQAGYALIDRQLVQLAPSSAETAYRGVYIGASAFVGQEKALAFARSYEARAYVVGPFQSRATDLISFVYSRQEVSHHLSDAVNNDFGDLYSAGFPVPRAAKSTNSYTVSYLAHLCPGLYTNIGISYTDRPSLLSVTKEGSSLLGLLSLISVF